jgi:hypothetical protein
MGEQDPQKKPIFRGYFNKISYQLIGVAFVFVLTAFGIWYISRLDAKGAEEYQQMMSIFDSSANAKPSSYQASQNKIHLQKDILLMSGKQPLQLRLCADNSELVFEKQEDRDEIYEKLHGVNCVMQEELYYLLPDGREVVILDEGELKVRHASSDDPNAKIPLNTPGLVPRQIVRYLEAEKAIYHYKNDSLVADEVLFSRYTAFGHRIDEIKKEKMLMEGIADKIKFSLSSHLNFKVYGMKASFFKSTSEESL